MDKIRFNNNRNAKNVSPENTINIISESTEINGNIKAISSFRIEGKVKGEIFVEGKIVFGKNATQEGDVHCQEIEISGNVFGNIFADKIFLKSTANVKGNITTKQLIIESGVKFCGNCKMGELKNQEMEKVEDYSKDVKK